MIAMITFSNFAVFVIIIIAVTVNQHKCNNNNTISTHTHTHINTQVYMNTGTYIFIYVRQFLVKKSKGKKSIEQNNTIIIPTCVCKSLL